LRVPCFLTAGKKRAAFGESATEVEVNWSSCCKSISHAAATVAHYQKIVALAAQIQAFLEETRIED
jgi:hypothetical protein